MTHRITAAVLQQLPTLKKQGDLVSWGQLHGAGLPLTLVEQARQQPNVYLLVVADTPTALRLEQELRVFADDDVTILTLPDWETLPYDVFSPHQDIISQRLRTLYQLPQQQQAIVIVPVNTLLLRVCSPEYLAQHSLLIETKQQLDLVKLKQQLTAVGYRAVDQVMEHGEFSVRGSLLDLYPMGSQLPYRIDFFDDEIDGIRIFDPDSQRTLDSIDKIELLPAHEYPTDQAAIDRFRSKYREQFNARTEPESLYQQVSKGVFPAGIEYYFPLFSESSATLFDYLPASSTCLLLGDIEFSADRFWRELQKTLR